RPRVRATRDSRGHHPLARANLGPEGPDHGCERRRRSLAAPGLLAGVSAVCPGGEATVTPAAPGAEKPLVPECSTPAEGMKRRRKRGRGYSRSGFYTLKATLRTLGPRVVDRRTSLGKALAAWKADLVRDLGGDVSTQQTAVIELAVRTKL